MGLLSGNSAAENGGLNTPSYAVPPKWESPRGLGCTMMLLHRSISDAELAIWFDKSVKHHIQDISKIYLPFDATSASILIYDAACNFYLCCFCILSKQTPGGALT